jgi:hypothetical protein
LGLLPQHTNWFIPWRFYRTISNEVESQLTSLDINSTFAILRSLYQGTSDHLLRFYEFIGDDIFNACSQWASTPLNGDLVISFADDTHQAHNNQLHHFNLYELSESDPP